MENLESIFKKSDDNMIWNEFVNSNAIFSDDEFEMQERYFMQLGAYFNNLYGIGGTIKLSDIYAELGIEYPRDYEYYVMSKKFGDGEWHNVLTAKILDDCKSSLEKGIESLPDTGKEFEKYRLKVAANKIWNICKESPEMGNAVMDLIGDEAYHKVMKFHS